MASVAMLAASEIVSGSDDRSPMRIASAWMLLARSLIPLASTAIRSDAEQPTRSSKIDIQTFRIVAWMMNHLFTR
jgi:hypothetical protein